ncbi:DUF547 domain-containing protein [Actomonas aquatica]|uniref:DUF547 domain-containing protein n=1 Tax=Actomonas aquatica TaxID=2866162 RepID=A0ABZ1C3J8_9BACT|nr:DUF547 domain-containing protein [Opitutus sp. WL0086]WRQ86291.1 DUF547 domain-containing protein [Opitutus sp. WL0086]
MPRALLLFLAPLWVALTSLSAATAFTHDTFDALLHDHVEDGRVDYAALRTDPRLDAYLAQLATTDPATLDSADARLAFWINAYNAYTLKLVLSVYPIDSIKVIHGLGQTGPADDKAPWEVPLAVVNGEALTLNQIEHAIIRQRWDEPRIHFALVCAALSCAQLRAEAYSAAQLETQLQQQAEWFFAHRNTFDPRRRQAALSQLLNWYRADFATTDAELLRYAAQFLPDDLAKSLRQNPGKWKITYQPYDWTLNAQ